MEVHIEATTFNRIVLLKFAAEISRQTDDCPFKEKYEYRQQQGC